MIEQPENLLHVGARPLLEPVRPERMVEDEQQSAPAQVPHQVMDVAAQTLHLAVRRLVEAEDVDMEPLAGPGKARLHLLADDDLRGPVRPRLQEPQGPLDRVVVGERDVVHAGPLRPLEHVDRLRV